MKHTSRTGLKRAVSIAAVLGVSVALAGCAGGGSGSGSASGSYVLGFNDDLSGPISFAGLTELAGVETYIDNVNANGGVNGRQIVLKTLDTRADGATSISNYKQLVNDDGAIAVLGNSGSSALAATGPQAAQAKVLMIGTGNADDFFSTYNPYLFKNGMTQVQHVQLQGKLLSDYLFKTDPKNIKVAIMATDTAGGPPYTEAVQALADANGWTIVESQVVGVGATDCTAQASKIAASGADVILGNITSVGEDIVCFNQLKAQGFDKPFVETVSSAAEKTYATLADPNWITLRTYNWWDDTTNPGIAAMLDQAKKFKHDGQLGAYSSDGYVSAALIVKALGVCKDDCTGETVAAALGALTDVDTNGIAGPKLGYTDGDLGHTVPQARFYQWDAAKNHSEPYTDWLTVDNRG
ncbi:MAG: branched-chain amino acid transport system substrate-binding protein [Subtercola sp.]|nr:branched-chain amino acid transport system substrate-binding protein [Subtercola sp.]